MVDDGGERPAPPLAYRLAGAGFVFLALIGAGLLIASWRGRSPPRAAPAAGSAAVPEWVARSLDKAVFTRQVRAGEGDAGTGDKLLSRLFQVQAGRGVGGAFAHSHWQLRRVAALGPEYDSELDLGWSFVGARGQVEVVVERRGREAYRLRAAVEGDQLSRLEVASPGRSYAEVRIAQDLPIGLGDFSVHDLLAFTHGARGGLARYLGTVATPNSQPLEVFEVPFASPAERAARGAAPAAGGRPPATPSGPGACALVYVDAEALTPRTLRVFDAGDRLVRTYTDLVYQGPEDDPRLDGFSVSSIPTSSTTFVRIIPALPPGPGG